MRLVPTLPPYRFPTSGKLLRCATAILGVSLSGWIASQVCFAEELDAERARNLVVLDATGVENLGIETQKAGGQLFEQVIFAVGRVEAVPKSRAAISSLHPGRVEEITVSPGDSVQEGAEVARVEVAGKETTASSSGPLVLTSPIAGMVTAMHAIRGQTFWRNKTLLEITDLREVDVIARVAEHEAAQLQPGSSARIRVPAACDKIFKATLVRFGTEGDRKHGTVQAWYRLANRDLLMRPGMRAELRIVAAERKTSAVPREAVQGHSADRFVFVKDNSLPHAFRRVPVVTGQRNDRFVEIVRGLAPDDDVVTTGAYALAFAGRGSVNLKAALDAAHGHAHADDGTPLDGEHEHHDHDHEEEHAHEPDDAHEHDTEPKAATTVGRWNPLTIFFATLSGLLTGLLALSRRARPESAS